MGKESKLRNSYKQGENRQQYANGDRKLYDRDACPSGLDEYVWHLTLMFEQGLELFGAESKRPIIYTEIYHKISSDKDLTSVLEDGRLNTSDMGDIGVPVVTTGNKVHNKLKILESMITKYFYDYDSNTIPSVNNFCSVFNSLKQQILGEEYIKLLKTQGTKIPQIPVIAHPDRREEKVRKALDITVGKVYTEKDMEEAFTKFRRKN